MTKTNELVPVKGQSRKAGVAPDAPPVQYHSVADIKEMAKAVATSRLFGPTEEEAFTLIMLADSDGKDVRCAMKFLVKIRRHGSGCWIWTGATASNGYGHFYMGDKSKAGRRRPTGAHCASHRLFLGPIPDGYEIDHLCKTRCCVHPLHIEAVTQLTNILRSKKVPDGYDPETHCKRGHPRTPENTTTNGNGKTCKLCRAITTKAYKSRIARRSVEDSRP